ncbi:hypothetical protein [Sphingomonas sp.]|uniref:hypothetical protein n=1 Tax=Sphingomonas sp. TaxID=28214 RepID=UPI00286C30A5|nr:hypothetical protein [Sphingomonas sp.]
MIGAARLNPLSGLQFRAFAHIFRHVSLRHLSAILIAFAMLFAPLAMETGSAMAMAPADHQSQMMVQGHCGDQPAQDQDGKKMGKSCCVAMCTAVALTAAAPVDQLAFAKIVDRPSLEPFHHSYLAQLATPPPRRA